MSEEKGYGKVEVLLQGVNEARAILKAEGQRKISSTMHPLWPSWWQSSQNPDKNDGTEIGVP